MHALVLKTPIYLSAVYHAINQPVYLLAVYHAINQPTYLPVVYHVINQPIYQLRIMQSISTVEADNKVILLLVDLYVHLLSDYL